MKNEEIDSEHQSSIVSKLTFYSSRYSVICFTATRPSS